MDQSHVRYDKSPPFQGTIGVNDTMNQNSENNYTMDANKTKVLYSHYLNSIVKSSSSPWAHEYSNATSRLGTHVHATTKKYASTESNDTFDEKRMPLALFMEEMHYVSVRHWQYLKGIENPSNEKVNG